jgi:uncharacterized protein YjdB
MAIDFLTTRKSSELLSYIINETPELRAEIELPVQGESIVPIGKIIVDNERYKNAFLNTINVIGLTIIKDNMWENPWDNFTEKGFLNRGQSIREIFVDIANVYDYNATKNSPTNFLNNVVPNILQYIHSVNYQKYYKTSTSDEEIAMAFESDEGIFNLINKVIQSLYRGYEYDKYIVEKYMLCKRMVDGTTTPIYIEDYATMTPRERVEFMKSYSNKLGFMSPNYNPAGVRVATPFDRQYLMMNTDFESQLTTSVLATSFFRNDAEFRTNGALIDGFGNHDVARLTELLGSQYVPFTSDELAILEKVPAVLFGYDFFQVWNYALNNNAETRSTMFFNPESLKTNHWLHTWKVVSTSPFENIISFVQDEPSITSVTISPASATITAGQDLKLTASVVADGLANKAVTWRAGSLSGSTWSDITGVTISEDGTLHVGADVTSGTEISVGATSVYDTSKSDVAEITVA